jgi:hypothetical protein
MARFIFRDAVSSLIFLTDCVIATFTDCDDIFADLGGEDFLLDDIDHTSDVIQDANAAAACVDITLDSAFEMIRYIRIVVVPVVKI